MNYFSKYFSDNFNNVNKIWRAIRSIISTKPSNNYTPTCLKVDNTIITDLHI